MSQVPLRPPGTANALGAAYASDAANVAGALSLSPKLDLGHFGSFLPQHYGPG